MLFLVFRVSWRFSKGSGGSTSQSRGVGTWWRGPGTSRDSYGLKRLEAVLPRDSYGLRRLEAVLPKDSHGLRRLEAVLPKDC